ncbi:MAG TPA: ABC transporter permease [Sphingobacteriaceae bacterium]
MLKNYLKIAFAVLKRRKFFTFISLFGISITLTILIVITAGFDHLLSTGAPEVNRDRSLYITFLKQENTKMQGTQSGPMSYYFLDHYTSGLSSVEKVAIFTVFKPTNTYVNNKKLVVDQKYTNAAYWEVLKYEFLEGKPFNQTQINNSEKVAVISQDLKKQYFGDVNSVVGKFIEADNVQYRVTGVVKDVPVTMPHSYANMYLPYTINKDDYRQKGHYGTYMAIILAKNKQNVQKIQDEFQTVVSKIPPSHKDFDKLFTSADPYLESYTRVIFGSNTNSGRTGFVLALTILAILFMLLPTINLVNINISRIMERSSEIGVRKAFGASSATLVLQFIVENILLTFLGGIIGVILSALIIFWINSSSLIAHAVLSINLNVLLYSMAACVFFGLLSGVYPAWKMSRLQVVSALKAQ